MNRSDGDAVKKTFDEKMASRETFLNNLTDDEVYILHGSIPDITRVHSTYVKELEDFALKFLSERKLAFFSRNAPDFMFAVLTVCTKLPYIVFLIISPILTFLLMLFFGFFSIFDLFIVFKYGGDSLASFQRDAEVEWLLAPIYRSIYTGFIGFDNFLRDVFQLSLGTKTARFVSFIIFSVSTLLLRWIEKPLVGAWDEDYKVYNHNIKKYKALRKLRTFLEQIDS